MDSVAHFVNTYPGQLSTVIYPVDSVTSGFKQTGPDQQGRLSKLHCHKFIRAPGCLENSKKIALPFLAVKSKLKSGGGGGIKNNIKIDFEI